MYKWYAPQAPPSIEVLLGYWADSFEGDEYETIPNTAIVW